MEEMLVWLHILIHVFLRTEFKVSARKNVKYYFILSLLCI